MAIRIDPENNETPALFDMVNFGGQRVLEIGCGNGRVTWRYADKAAHVEFHRRDLIREQIHQRRIGSGIFRVVQIERLDQSAAFGSETDHESPRFL